MCTVCLKIKSCYVHAVVCMFVGFVWLFFLIILFIVLGGVVCFSLLFFLLYLFHYFQCINGKKKLQKPSILGSKQVKQLRDSEQGAGKRLSEHHLLWPCWRDLSTELCQRAKSHLLSIISCRLMMEKAMLYG